MCVGLVCAVAGGSYYNWWFRSTEQKHDDPKPLCSAIDSTGNGCDARARTAAFVQVFGFLGTFVVPMCAGHARANGCTYKLKLSACPILCPCSQLHADRLYEQKQQAQAQAQQA